MDSVNLTAQAKASFAQHAVTDPATGDTYLGLPQFIDAVAPPEEDFRKIKREQYSILFKVADRKGTGRLSLSDWTIFENLLMKPDAEYEIAFRLFDTRNTGAVAFDDFYRLYEHYRSEHAIPIDWSCEWAKLYLGDRRHRHDMNYPQFSQMMRGLQGERVRQAFKKFDVHGDGYIAPEDFQHIILRTAQHKLSDHILENLPTLCNITPGARVSYATVRAFLNVIREMDLVETIVRQACAQSPDRRITRAEFLNQAARMSRYSLFTPLEADILFHFASLDVPAGRLGLADFDKVLDPTWQSPSSFSPTPTPSTPESTSSPPHHDHPKLDAAKAATRTVVQQFAESAYNFTLGSIAGAFGAFMVYPIDLVKTRLQNQRSARPGERLYKNSIDCFQKVFRNEGLRGLYSGVGPQLVGVAPEKAIKLTVNDLVRGILSDKSTGQIWWPYELVSGATAGGCQVVFTNPLEIVKIRLQVQGEMAKTAGAPPKRSAMWIVRNLGLVGLYKGSSACLLRDMPFSAIYFTSYNHLKKDLFHETPNHPLSILQLLTAGAIAGIPAAFLTTPCDVIKTRLQVESRKGEKAYHGLRHAARTIWRDEGFRAFFKGGPARVLRSSPQFGFTLAAYEVLQTVIPFPGSAQHAKNEAAAMSAKLGGAGMVTSSAGVAGMEKLPKLLSSSSSVDKKTQSTQFLRSRNALKIILDLDSDFGRVKTGTNAPGWQAIERVAKKEA